MNDEKVAAVMFVVCACVVCAPSPGAAEAPAGRYQATTNEVIDSKTGLTWQRAQAPSTYTWEQAKTYCATLSLEGKKWRLPSVKELLSIVDLGGSSPTIDHSKFFDTSSGDYWTSSPVVGNPDFAWIVYFDGGDTLSNFVNNSNRVRCVR